MSQMEAGRKFGLRLCPTVADLRFAMCDCDVRIVMELAIQNQVCRLLASGSDAVCGCNC